jgi:hypothetical protein
VSRGSWRGDQAGTGVFIAISNDRSYWRPVTHGRATNADAFRIHKGAMLAGTRAWGPNTGAGTMKGRAAPIELLGTHKVTWGDYSRTDATPTGTFRSLI